MFRLTLSIEKYSYFTTFCLLEFMVIYCRSVAFRIRLALSVQRDGVLAWQRDTTLHIEIVDFVALFDYNMRKLHENW